MVIAIRKGGNAPGRVKARQRSPALTRPGHRRVSRIAAPSVAEFPLADVP
jgi:hypothetical protein